MVIAVAPFKTVRVKNKTSEWVEGEIAEKIHTYDKLYRRFKFTKLHADEEIYVKTQKGLQNLVRKKRHTLRKN